MKCNLLVFLLAAFFALPTMAQEMHVVTGKVVDSGGEPLIGAGVIAKDGTATIQGTVTDSEGKFSLSAPESATLHVSYIGYMTNIVRVGNRTRFDIILQEDQTTPFQNSLYVKFFLIQTINYKHYQHTMQGHLCLPPLSLKGSPVCCHSE